jgi:PRTRC genetic system protein B
VPAEINIHALGESTLRLSQAVLIYTGRNNSEAYATLHDIDRGKGGTRIGAGRPATTEACAGFIQMLASNAAFSGFIAPQILYVGAGTVAWWRPPASTRVWFNTARPAQQDQTRAHIGERTGVTPHPGLVFALAAREWYVAALKGSARPHADTPLHIAPYFNVWRGGHICEGNVRRPRKVTPETIAAFERAFFESRFTHPNMDRLVRFKGGAGALWSALLDGKFKTFPERVLLPAGNTLAQWLKSLEKK